MKKSDTFLSILFCIDLAFRSMLIFYIIKNKIKSTRIRTKTKIESKWK